LDKTIILKNALELIAQGTVDMQFPLRCAPREVLMKHAKDALSRYEGVIRDDNWEDNWDDSPCDQDDY
jgi:hypothetical protein